MRSEKYCVRRQKHLKNSDGLVFTPHQELKILALEIREIVCIVKEILSRLRKSKNF